MSSAVKTICGGRHYQNQIDRRRAHSSKGYSQPFFSAWCPSRLRGPRHHHKWHCTSEEIARLAEKWQVSAHMNPINFCTHEINQHWHELAVHEPVLMLRCLAYWEAQVSAWRMLYTKTVASARDSQRPFLAFFLYTTFLTLWCKSVNYAALCT